MKTLYMSVLVVNRAKWMLMGLVLAVVLLFPHQDAKANQAPQALVNLGSAGSFAVLAFNKITSTLGGTINGDVGVSPGAAFDRGAPAVIVNGAIHLADSIAAQAQLDLTTAYNNAFGRPGGTSFSPDPGELGGRTLAPGVYKSTPGSASFGITLKDLTLDAQGNPDAVWIFQMESTLIVGTGRKVILANGAQARNIFWQVGSSATLGDSSVVKGNILALASITVVSGARLDGRALARKGAVTLDGNTVTKQPRSTDQPWRILLMN